MWLNQLWQRWMGRTGRTRGYRRRQRTQTRTRARLSVESLEERTLLSNYTANTAADLAADISAANANGGSNQITLASSSPYILTSALPTIAANNNLTIAGTGNTIDGANQYRLFDVSAGASLTLQNLTLQHGLAQGKFAAAEGGAIYSSGALNLSGVTVQSNKAVGSNGANPQGNAVGGNGASAYGGGIYVAGGSVTLTNDSLGGNGAVGGNGGKGTGNSMMGGSGGNAFGGGLYVATGTATLSNCSLQGNGAAGGAGGHGGNGAFLGHTRNNASYFAHGGNGGGGGDASGGGLYWAATGTLTITNSYFEGNGARGGAGGAGGYADGKGGSGGNAFGGGVYVSSGTANLNNDNFTALSYGDNAAQGGNGGGGGWAGHASNYFNVAGTGGPGGNGGNASGGALYVAGGIVTLSNVYLTDSNSDGGVGGSGGDGGGAAGNSGVGGNGGDAFGGVLFVAAGDVVLDNNVFYNNTVGGGLGGVGPIAKGGNGGNAFGGGVYVAGGNVSLNENDMDLNTVQGGTGGHFTEGYGHFNGGKGGDGGSAFGGGLYVVAGTVSLNADTLSNNKVQGGNGVASGVAMDYGISGGNGGAASGGGLYAGAGSISLTNDTLGYNTAEAGNGHNGGQFIGSRGQNGTGGNGGNGGNASGGGLDVEAAALDLINDTFSSNTVQAGNGGNGGKASMFSSHTPTGRGGNGGNGGNASGGGLFVGGGTTTLANTLIAVDTIAAGTAGTAGTAKTNGMPGLNGASVGPDVSGTVSSSDHDLIGNSSGFSATTSTGDILNPANVGLDPNGLSYNNGGPLAAGVVVPTIALVAGSQAIDAGDNNAAPGATDERGYARIVGSAIDIGAYGYQNNATVTATDLAVSGSVSSTISISGQLTYTLTVSNNGPTAQSNVTLADVLPASTTLVSWTVPSGWSSSAPSAGKSGTVSAWTGSLAAGASANFTLVVQLNSGTPASTVISNTASVGPTVSDPNPANNSITLNVTVPPATPTNLTASTSPTWPSSSQITLSWNSDAGATSYTLERSTDNSTWSALTTLSGTTYVDSGLPADQTYYYRIAASNAGGSSTYSGSVSDTTLAATPTGLTATTVSSSQINLSWNADSSAGGGFGILRSTDLYSEFTLIGTPAAGATTYSDTGLSSGTHYYYEIVALNTANAYSGYSFITGAFTLPATPTGLTATPLPPSQINLSWNAVSGANYGYVIERSTNSSGGFTVVGNTTSGVTAFSDTGLAANTTYYYEVCAEDPGGDSAFSGIVSASTALVTPALTAAGSGSSIELHWNSITSASSYTLERSADNQSWSVLTTTGSNQTGYSDTGLPAGATYYYRVQASDAAESSPWSASASATTAPPAPTGLTATAVSSSEIDLSWNSAPGATNYSLEWSTDDSTWFGLTSTSSTSYADTGRRAGATYYFRIMADNAAGDSSYSNSVSATALLNAPTGLTATAVSNYQMTLSWNGATGATSYTLERSTDDNTWSVLTNTSSTSYTDTGLQAGTTYYYRIESNNAVESSPWSVPVSVTTTAVAPNMPSIEIAIADGVSNIWVYAGTNGGPNALDYILQRSTDDQNWGTVAVLSTWTSVYNDTGLQPGTTYYYRVAASNTVATSPWSVAVSAITYPAAPTLTGTTGATASSLTNAQINLSWNSVTSATSYYLERSLVNDPNVGDSNWQFVAAVSGTSYTDTGLQSDTTYYYSIMSLNTNGVSESGPWSAPVSAVSSMTANEKYVQALYQKILDRNGAKSELDPWANVVSYEGQQYVANAFVHSSEHYTDLVNGMYSTYLGRSPGSAEFNSWYNMLASGQTFESVLSQFLATNEFFYNHCSGNNYVFVNTLYEDLLQRPADSGGLNYWAGQLNSGAMSRQTVAYDLLYCGEFRTKAVDALYGPQNGYSYWFIPNMLNRSASSSEVSGWANSGQDLFTMEVNFASCFEFYNDAQDS